MGKKQADEGRVFKFQWLCSLYQYRGKTVYQMISNISYLGFQPLYVGKGGEKVEINSKYIIPNRTGLCLQLFMLIIFTQPLLQIFCKEKDIHKQLGIFICIIYFSKEEYIHKETTIYLCQSHIDPIISQFCILSYGTIPNESQMINFYLKTNTIIHDM